MSRLVFNKIVAKLERLDEYLDHLAELQKANKESFLADHHLYGLAERYLQLAIEVLLDIGKLLIISENLRKPEDNQDIFAVLGERGILSGKGAATLTGIISFRNILMHDYEKIDREIVYQKLQERLADFREFAHEVVKFIHQEVP